MDYRALLKNVERTLSAVEHGEDPAATIGLVAEAIVQNFRGELGIYGGRLYVLREGAYVLERGFGRSRKVPSGLVVPPDYTPIRRVREEGITVADLSDPSVDRDFESRLGVTRFAAVSFGDDQYVLAFDVHPRVREEDLLLSLGIIRTVLDSKVRTEKLEGLLHDARKIQQSILPRSVPNAGDYDVFGLARPAELVGGDFYDFLPLTDGGFGVAVADASGHGLLAALLVRDVYVGLRMGIGGDLKIARTIERLNRILHRSRLTTKFVSLFYGEFEAEGEIVYVNAGHTPPIVLSYATGAFAELDSTGMVLGPSPDARYGRRALKMEPGDVMLLVTDGIPEAHDHKGREFGTERLRKLMVEHRKKPAKELAERVLEAVEKWSNGPAEDDRTVVVVRRLPRPKRPGELSGAFRLAALLPKP